MGFVYAEIEIINMEDLLDMQRGLINKGAVKQVEVAVRVDTRAVMLCINEKMQQYLQCPVIEKRKVQTASGQMIDCDIVGPVEIRFENRRSTVRAVVLPGESEPVLGRIPYVELDVSIDPRRRKLIVHPDRPDCAQVKV